MGKLEDRRKLYDIPDVPYLPMGKVVIVYRLPSETKTAGGLYIPGSAEVPKPMGVLIAAGLQARDILADALIEIGDVVWFGKYEGWETQVKQDPGNKGQDIIQLKVDGILGSEDAMKRVSGKKATHRVAVDNDEDSESYGEHFYEEVN